MHNMKELILSVFIFTFGFATATHAQQVNTLLTKKLPEAPGKEIEVSGSVRIDVEVQGAAAEREVGLRIDHLCFRRRRECNSCCRR